MNQTLFLSAILVLSVLFAVLVLGVFVEDAAKYLEDEKAARTLASELPVGDVDDVIDWTELDDEYDKLFAPSKFLVGLYYRAH